MKRAELCPTGNDKKGEKGINGVNRERKLTESCSLKEGNRISYAHIGRIHDI